MIQVLAHNNSGLFRTNKSSRKKKRRGRLFIRRSKIYRSIINNSAQEQNLTINYRPQLRHRQIRQKILDGAGDEKIITPSSSVEQKRIDFTELEQIFDNAIRNRLPLELCKEKPQMKDIVLTQHENLHPPEIQSLVYYTPTETRLDLSTVEPIEEIKSGLIAHIKQHKILSAITLVTFSVLLGFFSVFIFVKY